ncbi:hypothetical protein LQ318_09165 [Aliifodinibius salicampi]|uniref:Glycosyltransferase RgtA/B/C/D-like domain-containing protein n=1 Tax=Fodinibius salicampi TaxID=1920655 RepID=A0ABT3PZ65_9BACT|nr:hypothetical protein [Fodinibius salicampi]MCW9713071.1 hypothetical protein [Fodinibius salicampi]
MHIVFPILFFLLSLFFLKKIGDRFNLFSLLLGAYLVRVCFAAFNIIGFRFPLSDTSDIVRFQAFADEVVNSGFQIDFSSAYVWAGLIGIIEYFTGDDTFTPLLINSLYGTLTVWYAYRISFILLRERQQSYLVAVIISLVPALIFTSASYLREASTILFLTMFIYYLIEFGFVTGSKKGSAIMLFASSIMTAMFHGGFVLLPFLAMIYMAFKMGKVKLTKRTLWGGLFVILCFVGFVSLMIEFRIGGGKVHGLYNLSFHTVWTRLLDVISVGWMASYSQLMVQAPPIFGGIAIFKFLFSPFFAENFRTYDFVRMPLTFILFISLVKLFLRAITSTFKIRITYFYLLAIFLFHIVLFSIGSNDPDTAYRHYMKFFPVIIATGIPLGWMRYFRDKKIVMNGTNFKFKIFP